MAVTKKNVNGIFYFTYPSSDVFLKERNYFIFEGIDQCYITSVKIGNKTLNFGELSIAKPFYLDVSAYYAKYNGKFNVTINFDSASSLGDSTTITINATTYDCYDPYKELMPLFCGESGFIVIAPPHRMLFVTPPSYMPLKMYSLFVAKIDTNRYWEVNGVEYKSRIIIERIPILKNYFIANYKRQDGVTLDKFERIADLADASREWVHVTWRTRYGVDVSHFFYLDTYATDKDDAQEVESEYFYKENSKHVIKGSFYLDNIKEPYDLWYYLTLANSELVTLSCFRWNQFSFYYMPNSTTSLNCVKITGTNIKDAVVDGVTQSTITFDFEMR